MKPTLNELTAFLSIAEHLNFRRAAVTLGVSPSALSHTIRLLESRVGTQLLLRTTRNVALTNAGAKLAAGLRPALEGIDESLAQLADEGDTLSGRIAITASERGGQLIIERAFGSFRQKHPGVQLEICTDLALEDLLTSGCDAGIRLRDQVVPDMSAVPIGPKISAVTCASPDYLQKRDVPETPSDLASHECIRQRLATGSIHRWEFDNQGKSLFFEPQGALTFNSHWHMVSAALAGQGIAYVPSHHVERHLESGELVQVLAGYSRPLEGFCLYYPINRHPTKTFSAFVAHVRSTMQNRSTLSGTSSAVEQSGRPS
ncbi:LysR family transcriptional regulator [Rhizobium leguminosarum]|uniref:LysR family transcriptional regulator n=1 Tax=Rhizobium leguminosarum TaxID=384 RepID=UPI001C95466C|nr:LysR family transcriptional regulator [Rhizobium leguminosarum]MBY5377353.1 LysR family transcriptional regulator [Rhizobium leguminosarum]